MILGLGSDIIDVRRIEKLLASQGKRFTERSFTENERDKAARRGKAGAKAAASTYAKHFAAKEACAKALGCGIGKQCGLKDMEIRNLSSGAPTMTLSGQAKKRLASLTPRGRTPEIFLTLADEYPYALAFVVITATKTGK